MSGDIKKNLLRATEAPHDLSMSAIGSYNLPYCRHARK